jgi:DNA-binding MarR family transcriptional regulator
MSTTAATIRLNGVCAEMTVEPLHQQNQSINYRVYALASSLSKGAMRFYQAKFGIALPEMRLLSTLGSHRRLSSLELVKLTAMDKGLVSRVLAGLAKRNLVQDVPAAAGSSRRVWKLTAAGSTLVARLRPVWQEREGQAAGRSVAEGAQAAAAVARNPVPGVREAARRGSQDPVAHIDPQAGSTAANRA